jgi:23S rRNA (cytosine1962-C5)-methyltransferase
VLDAYSYVGAFAVAAARGGATEVVAVDESALAVEVGAECAQMNGVSDRVKMIKEDARRAFADAKGSFDLVIADPPRLAPTRGARDSALIAYSRLAENACRATRPGGLVVLCSCSAAIDLAALTRALASGATRANMDATVLERWYQGADHPVPAAFGEGLYLKSVIARVEAR